MRPKLWGSDTWQAMHYIAMGYPTSSPSPSVRASYAMFFRVIGDVLPCGKCSSNYARHFADAPVELALDSRDDLFKWTVDLHNTVNLEQGKRPMSYATAAALYTDRSDAIIGGVTSSMWVRIAVMLSSLVGVTCLIIILTRRMRMRVRSR